MAFAPGVAYERTIPDELTNDPDRVRRMSEELVDELAAIHTVDPATLGFLGDGRDFIAEQIAFWSGEMRRVQLGPLPALESLLAALEASVPPRSDAITLVHGDAKPGNFAFVGSELTASFDWEMSFLGDPMADVAYAQVTWELPGMFTTLPSSLSIDELVTRYEQQSGIATHDLVWHRSFQRYKLGVIMLIASMLFDSGESDDPRFSMMGRVVAMYTTPAFADLGLDNVEDQGAVMARPERLATLEG
jgi:aminoglycoside phosphotransferase (APT) family kinase protein